MIKKLATIGNSYGVIIDRPLLREAGIGPHAKIELTVENGAVIVRPVADAVIAPPPRRNSAQISPR